MRRSRVVAGVTAGVLSVGAAGAIAASPSPSGSSAAVAGSEPSQAWKDNLSATYLDWQKSQPKPKKQEKPSTEALKDSARKHRGRHSATEARRQLAALAPSMTTGHSLVPDPDVVARPLSATTVQLKGENGNPGGIAVSNIPIAVPPSDRDAARRIQEWKLADLNLESSGDRYRVKRSLLPVSVPKTAGGISRVDDLAAHFAPTDATSTGSVSGETITYPNVQTDTDLTLRTSSASVKAGWTLRSPAAPTVLKIPLELPDGASAKVVADDGAIAIVDKNEKSLGSISPPSATDSAGAAVDLQTKVVGDTVEITVDHSEGKTAYPAVVDPVFARNWETTTTAVDDFVNWPSLKSRPQVPFSFAQNPQYYGQFAGLQVSGAQGPATTSTNPNGYTAGDYATFRRYAPGNQATTSPGSVYAPSGRRISNEHAFWYRADLTGIDYSYQATQWYHLVPDPTPTFAFLPYNGGFGAQTQKSSINGGAVADGGAQNYPQNTTGWTTQVWIPGTVNPNNPDDARVNRTVDPSRPDNLFVAGLFDRNYYGGNLRPTHAVFLGGYTLYATDDVAPTVGTPSNPGSANWTNDPATVPTSTTVTTKDNGTGIERVQLRDSSNTAVSDAFYTCVPSGDKMCEYSRDTALTIPAVGEGRTTFSIVATDGGGKASAATTVPFAVDTGGPTFDATTPVTIDPTTRKISTTAYDGDPAATSAAAQRSGVSRVEIYVDDQLVSTTNQTVAGDNKSLYAEWTPAANQFLTGDHNVQVVAYDRVGNDGETTATLRGTCCTSPVGDVTVDPAGRTYRLGDVNGDSQTDLVFVSSSTGATGVRLGQGNGTFQTEAAWGSFGEPISRFVLADMDRDGSSDLVAQTTSNALRTRLSTGSGTVLPDEVTPGDIQATWSSNRTLSATRAATENTAEIWGLDNTTGALTVSSGSEFGPLVEDERASVPSTLRTVLADVTGDEQADLVTYDPVDGAVRLRELDDGQYQASTTWGSGPSGATAFVAGDINGDGLADLVFRVPDGANPDKVLVHETSADGGFLGTTPRSLGTLDPSFALQVDDVNGDAKADVIGTKVDASGLNVRSVASTVPDPEQADTRPLDPAAGDGTSGLAARAKVLSSPPILMGQADTSLLWRRNIGLNEADARASFVVPANDAVAQAAVLKQLQEMRHIGITRLRIFVYWGQVDRLHPSLKSTITTPNSSNVATVPGMDPSAGETSDSVIRDYSLPGAPKIQNRWLLSPYKKLIQQANAAGMKVHLTLTGGLAPFTECVRYLPQVIYDLKPRGCYGSGKTATDADTPAAAGTYAFKDRAKFEPTGYDPDPDAFRNFVAETVAQLRSSATPGGTSIESVGMWNEPNLATSRSKANSFLAVTNDSSLRIDPGSLNLVGSDGKVVTKSLVNSATRYGKLYTAGYRGLVDAGADGAVSAAFGELTSGSSSFNASTSPRNKRAENLVRPGPWTETALAAAQTAWKAQSADGPTPPPASQAPLSGTIPIVKALAVHPYLHEKGPWSRSSKYTFGPAGLSRTGSAITEGALQTLGRAVSDKNVATSSSTTTGSRPPVWATEFGYRSLQTGKRQSTSAHSETQRWPWLRYRGTGKTNQPGALKLILKDAGARRLNLYGTFELPPKKAGPAGTGDAQEDYGIIGSGLNPAKTLAGGDGFGYGAEQLGLVKGIRPYLKAGSGVGVGNTSSRRQVACEIRSFAKSEGVAVPASTYADPNASC